MAWLNSKPQTSPAPSTGASDHHVLDIPVKLNLRSVKEQVVASLLHVALSGCRLRTWMMMERGTALSFNLRLSDGRTLTLCGVVAARYPARNGTVGFEYAVALDTLPHGDADALSREAALLVRHFRSGRAHDTSLIDISRFTGFRVPDDFTAIYRVEDSHGTTKTAQASDITGNALRLRCDDTLRVGDTLLLVFMLPGADQRRSAEIKLRAFVAAQVRDSRRRLAYELEFIDLDAHARDQIARYLHAAQLAQLKR